MKKYLLTFISLLLLATPTLCQNLLPNKETVTDLFAFPSTLSLRNLQTSQSFTFSTTYSSGTNKAFYLSNFTNRFELPLSSKLKIALDLNVVNFGEFGSSNPLVSKENTKILPNFMMKYTPTENIKIYLEINSYNPLYTPLYMR
ncbi:MAG TPA: hypothetical protein ENG70_03140 [Candidatus Cloacimonetes bacterium]|nr:hypothetical protein [Candidatus Cloacimonadota bacterium]HEX37839.1 hypothetical protein [Candidatus Cloacimonadota bacterium]